MGLGGANRVVIDKFLSSGREMKSNVKYHTDKYVCYVSQYKRLRQLIDGSCI